MTHLFRSVFAHTVLVIWLVSFCISCSDQEQDMQNGTIGTSTMFGNSPQQHVQATVINVIAGDLIELDLRGERVRVRYLGIAIPKSTGSSTSPFGEQALNFNKFLVLGQMVELEFDSINKDVDGTLLRYVYVDGEMANLALITNGYASVSSFPSDFKYRLKFLLAEENAKKSERGMWTGESEGRFETSPPSIIPTTSRESGGGTLPLPPSGVGLGTCDFSNTSDAVIKGNVDSNTDEKVYHIPGSLFYSTTLVEPERGDRWFCTESEALSQGWKRSKR